ncbi:MAG: UDP-N-acetylglucosamine 2-epimerase [Candidatus Thorarchaeota archaeon]
MVTKITVTGMDNVGIPCAALLADVDGFQVIGLLRRSKRSGWKIEHLNAEKAPFEGDELGLDELIAKVVAKGSFRVTDDVDVLRDLGGIQEEVTAHSVRKKVLELRTSTEQYETFESGYATGVGVDPDVFPNKIRQEMEAGFSRMKGHSYGTGNASKKIIDILLKQLE